MILHNDTALSVSLLSIDNVQYPTILFQADNESPDQTGVCAGWSEDSPPEYPLKMHFAAR